MNEDRPRPWTGLLLECVPRMSAKMSYGLDRRPPLRPIGHGRSRAATAMAATGLAAMAYAGWWRIESVAQVSNDLGRPVREWMGTTLSPGFFLMSCVALFMPFFAAGAQRIRPVSATTLGTLVFVGMVAVVTDWLNFTAPNLCFLIDSRADARAAYTDAVYGAIGRQDAALAIGFALSMAAGILLAFDASRIARRKAS